MTKAKTRRVHAGLRRGFLGLLPILVGLALGGCDSSTTSTPSKHAFEAADVGDVVTIRYPASEIMCSNRDDASNVYLTGEAIMRQTYRVENSFSRALDAEREAKKFAMQSASSCQWAPDDDTFRFVVTKKDIVGSKETAFYIAAYCLKPENKSSDTCWWIETTATNYTRFKNVATKKVSQ